MSFKGWLCLFPDFGFFCKKNQKLSTVTSNCHLGMGVGAFESSDDEETFFFLFYGNKMHRKILRPRKLGNFGGFHDSFQGLCTEMLLYFLS